MKKTYPLILLLALSIFIFSCGNAAASKQKKTATGTALSKTATNDTLSNQPQCSISIGDEQFVLPADNISTGYTFSDSSIGITFKGLSGGGMAITIPNLFKCPCSIPTGYSSIRFKIAGTEEYSVEPTVTLYNYPIAGISLNNLNDGYHKKEVTDKAIEITSIQKTNENTNVKWAEYLIKGKIHTTVLKNVYEAAAGEKNKDYEIKGKFVIQTKIYL